MPFHEVLPAAIFYDKEILRGADGLNDIKSMVVDSTYVVENPAASGRYVLEAGTVMCKVVSSSKIRPAAASGEVAADIVGILGRIQEFWLGPGITAGSATDQPVNILHFNAHFNVSKLVMYSGNAAQVLLALPHCKFT
jgi:hypothetical protein